MTGLAYTGSKRIIWSFLSALYVLVFLSCTAGNCLAGMQRELDESERTTKTIQLNVVSSAIVLTWGVLQWDYFQQSPKAESEEWFGRNTDDGGADKLGHMYITYALTHLWDHLYRNLGSSPEGAARMGALSSLGVTGLMELGDSFSNYGFSYEDMLMNLAGSALGYLMLNNDELARKIDFRVEYSLSNKNDFESDVVTDYQHLKYLFALKADGFESINNRYLKYLELHLGYYSRGYNDWSEGALDERERTIYAGIGINVGKLIAPLWKNRIFEYVQIPHTYVPIENTFND